MTEELSSTDLRASGTIRELRTKLIEGSVIKLTVWGDVVGYFLPMASMDRALDLEEVTATDLRGGISALTDRFLPPKSVKGYWITWNETKQGALISPELAAKYNILEESLDGNAIIK